MDDEKERMRWALEAVLDSNLLECNCQDKDEPDGCNGSCLYSIVRFALNTPRANP